MDYNKDYYKELGLNKDSSEEEIKKKYRKLAIKHHPDKNQGDKESEEKFKSISEAYEVLSDNTKKQEYDTRSPNGKSYSPFGGFESSFFGGGGSSFFNQFFGGSSPFGDFFRNEEFSENLDINININIDFKQIYQNDKITIKYNKFINCDDCKGTGFDQSGQSDECDVCDGTGINNGRTCEYCQGSGKIYSGKCKICKGEKVILKETELLLQDISEIRGSTKNVQYGYGSQSKYYKDKVGSLILNINTINRSKCTIVNNYDLISTVDVHYQDAIDGSKINYTHVDDSNLEIKLPIKTNNNDTIKLKEKGLLKQDGKRADLYLKINIVIDYDKLNI